MNKKLHSEAVDQLFEAICGSEDFRRFYQYRELQMV